jgi:hypothetical protein
MRDLIRGHPADRAPGAEMTFAYNVDDARLWPVPNNPRLF